MDIFLEIIKIILFFIIFFSLFCLNAMDKDASYEYTHKQIQKFSIIIVICAIILWKL